MSEEHLTDAQPRHPDPGMDALIKHLDSPEAPQPTPLGEPTDAPDPLALEAVVPEEEAELWQERRDRQGRVHLHM